MTIKRRNYHTNPSILLQDDDYLNIPQAIKWIEDEYTLQVTRHTLYRWIKTGMKGARWRGKRKRKLYAIKVCGQLTLKKQWINNFIAEVSVC